MASTPLQGLKNWDKARIATKIAYADPNTIPATVTEHELKLVNRISIKKIHDFVPYGGITEWNQGYIERPPQYSFTIAIPATSNTTRLLRVLHSAGISFNMEVRDKAAGTDNVDQEFALISETLIECKLIGTEINIVVADLPMVVYNGLALRSTYTDGDEKDSIDGNLGTVEASKMFGSGAPIPNTINLFNEEWMA